MATIQIKNVGPISDTGKITLTSVMLIIGRQSSGKSTFMKILCFCRWLEKTIMTSDEKVISFYTQDLKFINNMKKFYRFSDNYFSSKSHILYEGDVLTIEMKGSETDVKITLRKDFEEMRYNTKLCFIPSERNLVSVISNVDKAYRSSELDMLFNYIFEWSEAKKNYSSDSPKKLSFAEDMEYVNEDGKDYVNMLKDGISLPVFNVSSGVQSAMPLDVLTDYVTGLVGKNYNISLNDISNKILRYTDSSGNLPPDIFEKFMKDSIYQSVQLFIEEPEQNLYPESQKKIILEIISSLKNALPKGTKESMVVMTTHSPYMLSVLNVLMAWADAMEKKPNDERLKQLINEDYLMPLSVYSAYFISKDGTFEDIIDKEMSMISGNELDGVSDWVEEQISEINNVVYGENEEDC